MQLLAVEDTTPTRFPRGKRNKPIVGCVTERRIIRPDKENSACHRGGQAGCCSAAVFATPMRLPTPKQLPAKRVGTRENTTRQSMVLCNIVAPRLCADNSPITVLNNLFESFTFSTVVTFAKGWVCFLSATSWNLLKKALLRSSPSLGLFKCKHTRSRYHFSALHYNLTAS